MKRRVIPALALLGFCCSVLCGPRLDSQETSTAAVKKPSRSRFEQLGLPPDTNLRLENWRTVEDFREPLAQFETVFWEPLDTVSLRRLIRETPLVKGKTVLEIGVGSGLVSLCCLKAGAAKVVATDVNPSAIANAAYNAERLGFGGRLETRWVPRDRPAAYTVLGASERFDLIISNPPWENRSPDDIAEYALYDENFTLMRSMLEGLHRRLAPNGKALLVYGVVDAIRTMQQLARQHRLAVRVLDDRKLDELAAEFLPGMLLELRIAGASADDNRDAEASTLRVVPQDGRYCVEIRAGGQAVLQSPPEGLWSIATDWRDGWSAEWRHAHAVRCETLGPWTVLHGRLESPDGTWELRDAYRQAGRAVQCVRRYTWGGKTAARRCTLAVRWQARAAKPQVLLPGIVYYGNPSGASSGRVPVFTGQPGEEAIFEEHRYPIPMAVLEWRAGRELRGAALHTLPSPAPHANLPDQWWSLGVAAYESFCELLSLSGPCASNGKRSVIKARQPGFAEYPDAFLNVPPGAIIEKTFLLEAYPVETAGSGFRRPLYTAIDYLQPYSLHGMPTFAEIVQAKYRFAKSRWRESGEVAGFKKYPDRTFFVMGWCGQAAAPGYALQVLAERLGDPEALHMAQASLDWLSHAEFYREGFHTWYDYEAGKWSHEELLSQGQAMLSFARAIRVGRERGGSTAKWEAFLRHACDVHAARILADDWRPRSTDQAFFIAPLCEASLLFHNPTYRQAAVKAADHYGRRHVSMQEPYWGGTLDARCEDKEGAYAALQGFLAVYELTGGRQCLEWARHACDVVLTYVVLWDIDLPAGRLRNHAFKTRGWTVVSPQNQHIDVFGVLIAPEIYRLGQILNDSRLQQLALLMYRSCGQLLDPYGSQGEQPQHTNYAQRGDVNDVFALRGGYAETWTVFWITAHFLSAAARLQELGAPIWTTPSG